MSQFHLFIIKGVVQGVGFRPFVYREAVKRNLKGFVKNTPQGVEILADDKAAVFEILKNLPPLAKVEHVEVQAPSISLESREMYETFRIAFSSNDLVNLEGAKIPADTATCDNCVTELLDPKNRRHGYFFISCTNCGPRFSIAEKIPFDRKNTSLKDFNLCKKCDQEYGDPMNCRFHAQTTACDNCGPQLEFYEKGEKLDTNPLLHTIELLQKNEIVSIKGVGGFFLTCVANASNTQKLRVILKRPKKPFALMVKDLEMAEKLCKISAKEKELLLSKERPIVLCETPSNSPLTRGGPNRLSENDRLGIMLPYSGLHHLLFEKIDQPLIVTSANMPGFPIPLNREDQDWDFILDYNRAITNFSDDSIFKVIEQQSLLIRRSRGFVPQTIEIPQNYQTYVGDILAVGTEMKNVFAFKKGNQITLSPHLGNMEGLENFENFKITLDRFLKLTQANPQMILCDANPEFQISAFAKMYAEEKNIKCIPVQHHLAHVFSVALEHDLTNFCGIAADGTGYGEDGKVWGGEVFRNNKRVGHLEYQKLVGGDAANKEPIRFLVGILEKFMDLEKIPDLLRSNPLNPPFQGDLFRDKSIKVFYQQAQQNFNCIETSSCGRVLDAAAILLGFGDKNHYEGYLAEMLEAGVQKGDHKNPLNPPYQGDLLFDPVIEKQGDQYILMTTPLFEFLVKNLDINPREKLAYLVLKYLALGLYEIYEKSSGEKKMDLVFSGGCVYSSVMSKILISKGVKLNKNVPAGDGGISVGQIGYFLHFSTIS